MNQSEIVIWGASGHAAVVADAIRRADHFKIKGFIDSQDPSRRGQSWHGFPILGGAEQIARLRQEGVVSAFVAIGDPHARCDLADEAREFGLSLPSVIHPAAIVAADVTMGNGVFVGPGAIVNPGANLGDLAIVNSGAIVEHHCVIGKGAHIAPGARLAGRVRIEARAWVGIGTTVIEQHSVGAGSFIGAGAVVVTDIPAGVKAFGVPARVQGK